MYEPLAVHLGAAFTTVHLMEWLKKWNKFPWLNHESEQLNRFVSLVVAGLTTLGITVNTVGDWTSGGTIMINVPPGSVLMEAGYRFAVQHGLNRLIYKHLTGQVWVVKPPETLALPKDMPKE